MVSIDRPLTTSNYPVGNRAQELYKQVHAGIEPPHVCSRGSTPVRVVSGLRRLVCLDNTVLNAISRCAVMG